MKISRTLVIDADKEGVELLVDMFNALQSGEDMLGVV